MIVKQNIQPTGCDPQLADSYISKMTYKLGKLSVRLI